MKQWVAIGIAVAILALFSGAEADKDAAPGKGFWKILVKPKAKWVLQERADEGGKVQPPSITIETYDVRKIGDADVARLRFTQRTGPRDKEPTEYNDGADSLPTQIAVTAKGMYLLRADLDDAAVTAALQKSPSRSDPPKPYTGTVRNHGRYLRIAELGIVCMGSAHVEGDGECEERCSGEICISGIDGIVSMDGTYTPQDSWYLAKSYKADYSGDPQLHFRSRKK